MSRHRHQKWNGLPSTNRGLRPKQRQRTPPFRFRRLLFWLCLTLLHRPIRRRLPPPKTSDRKPPARLSPHRAISPEKLTRRSRKKGNRQHPGSLKSMSGGAIGNARLLQRDGTRRGKLLLLLTFRPKQ